MYCSRCGTQVDTSVRFCPTCGLDLSAVTGAGQGATARMAAAPAAEQDESAIIRDALKEEYDLEKELGRGGMAVVYKGRDKQLEREVAIKVLPFSLSFDAEFVERFQREARTAGKLEHPNIIPIYRVGKSGRVIYFVMKFIRGKSLSAVIEARGALPVPEAKRMLIEAARALGYAHKHGIVHRDIKPDNIMFDELGQAIVADFGIAKAQSGARLTGTGMAIGTPHYMSPEQARAQNLDGRSDIYSLGVVGYQSLTGRVPFDGEDSFSIGYKHIMEELPTPALETAEQRELFAVVQKMMAKKPEDRFQTAEELIQALESGGGTGMSMADMSTMPTRAIEPMKPPATKAAPPVSTAATAPLPRASASMGKPADAAGGAAAPAKKAARPAPPKPKSKAPVFAGLAVVVVAGGLAGGYFGVVRPKQIAQARADSVAQAQRDSVAQAQRLAAADTVHHDSLPATPADGNASRHPAPPSRPTAESNRRVEAAAPPAGRPGTLRVEGAPPNADIKLDGRSIRANAKDVPSGRRRLVVTAPGYERFEAQVDIPPGSALTYTVHMVAQSAAAPEGITQPAGGAANCDRYQVNLRNPNGACYDSPPAMRRGGALSVAVPSTCNRVKRATMLVRVSTSGDVEGTPVALIPSGCAAFDQAATDLVRTLSFTPARKAGAPVEAYYTLPVSPQRQ